MKWSNSCVRVTRPASPTARFADPEGGDVSATGAELTRELISAERTFIHALLRDGRITDERAVAHRTRPRLEEASLTNREYRGTAANAALQPLFRRGHVTIGLSRQSRSAGRYNDHQRP